MAHCPLQVKLCNNNKKKNADVVMKAEEKVGITSIKKTPLRAAVFHWSLSGSIEITGLKSLSHSPNWEK